MGTPVPAARESITNLAPLSGLPSGQGPQTGGTRSPCTPCLWQKEYRSIVKSCVLTMPGHSGVGHRWTFGRTAHTLRRALEAFTSAVCLDSWSMDRAFRAPGAPGLLAPRPCGVPRGTAPWQGVVVLAAPPLPLSHTPTRHTAHSRRSPLVLLFFFYLGNTSRLCRVLRAQSITCGACGGSWGGVGLVG